jgi:hypothetical protein
VLVVFFLGFGFFQMLSALIATLVAYPFDLLKTRQVGTAVRSLATNELFAKIQKEEGYAFKRWLPLSTCN